MARAFRLAGLLRLRQVQQEQAASDLEAANARARETAVRRNHARAALGAVPSEATSGTVLYAIAAARASSRSMLAELEALEFDQSASVERATATFQAARARSLGLEKLERRHDAAEDDADIAAQQVIVDEIATTGAGRDRTGEHQ